MKIKFKQVIAAAAAVIIVISFLAPSALAAKEFQTFNEDISNNENFNHIQQIYEPAMSAASKAYYIDNGNNIIEIHFDDFPSQPQECWAYANNFYKKIWGVNFSNAFDDSSNSLRCLSDNELTLTADHLKKYVSHAALGSTLRVCDAEYLHGSDGWGHSQIIVQKDENGFTVFEGGLTNAPHCREHYYTWNGYADSNWPGSYAYIKYIKWPSAPAYEETPVENTVTYDANGGYNAPEDQTFNIGESVTLSTQEPLRAGYTFINWNTKQDGTGNVFYPGDIYSDNASVTLYAQWAYNGTGENPDGVKAIYLGSTSQYAYFNNALVNFHSGNKKTTFQFTFYTGSTIPNGGCLYQYGWSANPAGTFAIYFNNEAKVSVYCRYGGNNTTLKSKYALQPNTKYTAKINYTNGGNPVTEITIYDKDMSQLSYDSSSVLYCSTSTVQKGYIGTNGSMFYNTAPKIYLTDIKISATLDSDNSTLRTFDVSVSDYPVGANTISNGGLTLHLSGTNIETYYNWTSYAVDYDSRGGTPTPEKQYKLHNQDLTLSSIVPVLDNKEFICWNTSADGSGIDYLPGSTYTDNENVILYAKWKSVVHTVTFRDWDGTVLKTQQVDHGEAADAPADPVRTGYTFTGWDKAFNNVTSDLIVTAQYSINTYTVTFKDWDNTVLKTQQVNYGGAASAPADPVRTGYTFTGWDKAFNNVTSNLTVTAQYSINTYTVTFKDWDNTVLKTQQVNYGGAASAPADPERTGYTFIGWDKEFDNIKADTIVTAQYEKNEPDSSDNPTEPPCPEAVHFELETVKTKPGDDISVNFSVNGTYEAHGFRVFIRYDQSLLSLSTDKPLMHGNVWDQIVYNGGLANSDVASVPGQIGFAAIMPDAGFSASGTIFTINFHVSEDAAVDTVIPLTISVQEFNNFPSGGAETPIPFYVTHGNVEIPAYTLGDVNDDGVINTSDAVLILRYSLGACELTGNALLAADFNQDGVINTSDALGILRYSLITPV